MTHQVTERYVALCGATAELVGPGEGLRRLSRLSPAIGRTAAALLFGRAPAFPRSCSTVPATPGRP
jgi:hypothetical protein